MSQDDNVRSINEAREKKATKEQAPPKKIEERLTPRLAKNFCPVPSYFLANYHRLRPHENARGLTSTEAMVLIQLLDHKWTKSMPFPAVTTIAQRMGMGDRAIRAAIKNMEDIGYLLRHPSAHGGTNRYDLQPLFAALERLMDEDLAKQDEEGE